MTAVFCKLLNLYFCPVCMLCYTHCQLKYQWSEQEKCHFEKKLNDLMQTWAKMLFLSYTVHTKCLPNKTNAHHIMTPGYIALHNKKKKHLPAQITLIMR